MSVDYSSSLSPYENKGVCGIPEVYDSPEEIQSKVSGLATLLRAAQHVVVHTGAGISTATGIPDFRGPNGVWTLEKAGKIPVVSVRFEEAIPSLSHRAIVALEHEGFINFLITQNIDGLHLRSGYPRNRMAILHGDVFIEQCSSCSTNYIRSTSTSPTVGLRRTGALCTYEKRAGSCCRGKLYDTVLDWENDVPICDYQLALRHSKLADLHICIGTSLQMFPAADFALTNNKAVKRPRTNGTANMSLNSRSPKLVIINLQPTKWANRAAINLHAPADRVMEALCAQLNVNIPETTAVSGKFRPLTLLKSIHTREDDDLPWRILSHPENEGFDCIVQEELKDLKPASLSNVSSDVKVDEIVCDRPKTEVKSDDL